MKAVFAHIDRQQVTDADSESSQIVLVRYGERSLSWRAPYSRRSRRIQSRLVVSDPQMDKPIVLAKGRRLSRKLIQDVAKKIERHFPEGTVDHIDVKHTLIVNPLHTLNDSDYKPTIKNRHRLKTHIESFKELAKMAGAKP